MKRSELIAALQSSGSGEREVGIRELVELAFAGTRTLDEYNAREKIIRDIIKAKGDARMPRTCVFFRDLWPKALAALKAHEMAEAAKIRITDRSPEARQRAMVAVGAVLQLLEHDPDRISGLLLLNPTDAHGIVHVVLDATLLPDDPTTPNENNRNVQKGRAAGDAGENSR